MVFSPLFSDRAGIWKVEYGGESSHGYYGLTAEVKVDKELGLESFKQALSGHPYKNDHGLEPDIRSFRNLRVLEIEKEAGREGTVAFGAGRKIRQEEK